MATSRFESLIESEKQGLAEQMFKLAYGDSHGHAALKGQRLGLDKALELYRKASREDLEQDNS